MSADCDFDLGTGSFRISTQSAETQAWFDRGLIWCYAFAHEEAVHCFRRATGHDPDCAMAWWGIAYASGPYYNKPWDKFDPVELENTLITVRAATGKALDCIGNAEPVERALVEALARRYPSSEAARAFQRWTDDYADAMREVHRSFPDDADVCALYAEALLNRTPWALWDLETGEPASGADTLEAIAALEEAVGAREAAGDPDHPGLLHMYIHALEMSPHPERALRACDRLRELVPDAGHLRHMPTHIDIQCGYYQATVDWNAVAVAVDRKLFEHDEDPGLWHTLSFAHNYHFMLYGAMFLGQYRAAMEATSGMVEAISESALRVESPPMADWLEGFVAMQVHAPIRFGKWREIIAMPFPEDRELYCSTTAMLHYAKGIAHAVPGDVPAARREQASFVAAAARVPPSRTVFNNSCVDVLAIAAQMLQGGGELPHGRSRNGVRAPASGNRPVRSAALRRALGLDAAAAACARRASARAGPGRGGGGGLPCRPRVRRNRSPCLPASGERLESARLPRMPRASRKGDRGPPRGSAARAGACQDRCSHRFVVPVPSGTLAVRSPSPDPFLSARPAAGNPSPMAIFGGLSSLGGFGISRE